jgi:antitoxin ParD1/3/4
LVRHDQERQDAIKQLRQMLDDAESSGVSDKTVEDIWEEAKSRYVKRHGQLPSEG